MNVLLIVPNDPRSRLHGGQQRTHAVWKGLKSLGDVWTIIPVQHKCDERRDELERIYFLCLETRYSVGWFLQRLWAKVFPRMTVPWGIKFPGKDGRCEIDGLRDVKFDITVVRFDYAGRLRPWRIAPMFIDVDDVPTDDYKRACPSHKIRLWLLRLWQNRLCRKARQLWVPDPKEKEMLPCGNVAYVPNIPMVDTIKLPDDIPQGQVEKRNVILFIGYLAHIPNQVALDWFLKTFWNDLKHKFPQLKYRIAGGGLPERYKREWSQYKDVELLGFVDNLNEVYASGCAILTPMRIGSGTCLKTLEALAYGMPIISTVQGLRGIPEEDRLPSNGIHQFENINDLYSIISNLISCDSLRQSSDASIGYIRNNFSQDVVDRNVRDAISDVRLPE